MLLAFATAGTDFAPYLIYAGPTTDKLVVSRVWKPFSTTFCCKHEKCPTRQVDFPWPLRCAIRSTWLWNPNETSSAVLGVDGPCFRGCHQPLSIAILTCKDHAQNKRTKQRDDCTSDLQTKHLYKCTRPRYEADKWSVLHQLYLVEYVDKQLISNRMLLNQPGWRENLDRNKVTGFHRFSANIWAWRFQ